MCAYVSWRAKIPNLPQDPRLQVGSNPCPESVFKLPSTTRCRNAHWVSSSGISMAPMSTRSVRRDCTGRTGRISSTFRSVSPTTTNLCDGATRGRHKNIRLLLHTGEPAPGQTSG